MIYKKQKENSGECGPVAIYNILKHLHIKANFKQIKKLLKHNKKTGTTIKAMINFLKNKNIKISHKRRPKIQDIISALKNKYCVLYLYQYDAEDSHYVIFTNYKFKNNTYYLKTLNEYYNNKHHIIRWVPIQYYKQQAKKYSGVHYIYYHERIPQAWIIKGKD